LCFFHLQLPILFILLLKICRVHNISDCRGLEPPGLDPALYGPKMLHVANFIAGYFLIIY
jgi:hypothetical protein